MPLSMQRREARIVFLVVRCECGKESQTRVENAGAELAVGVVSENSSFRSRHLLPTFSSGRSRTSVLPRRVVRPSPVHSWESVPFSPAFSRVYLRFCSGFLHWPTSRIRRKHVRGLGLAITGILLGSFTSLISLFLPVWPRRAGRLRRLCTNNLKQIALAMQNYESEYGCFPPFATYDVNGRPLLSWRS